MLNNSFYIIKKIKNKFSKLINFILKFLYSQKNDITFNETFFNSKNLHILKIKEILKKII